MTRSNSNFTMDKPHWLFWLASKNPFFVMLKLAPILLGLLYLIWLKVPFEPIHALYFCTGLVFWSFVEYAIHRWIYHIDYKIEPIRWFLDGFHRHHHNNLQDYRVLNAGFLLIYPIFILVFGLTLILTSWAFSLYFTLGVLLYYFFYENIHYFIHYKAYESGYMKWIQQYHLYHHYRNWDVNYGNTLAVWDRILGTYDARFKELELSQQEIEDLIRH